MGAPYALTEPTCAEAIILDGRRPIRHRSPLSIGAQPVGFQDYRDSPIQLIGQFDDHSYVSATLGAMRSDMQMFTIAGATGVYSYAVAPAR
jgi:hypothetical protein